MAATFDPSRQLDLYFRVNRAGSKVFNFVDSNGDAYTINGNTFQFILKDSLGNGIFTLTSGNGLTVATSSVTVDVTANQTNIPPAGYIWELYLSNLGKTWISGNAYFHTGVFDGVTDSTTLTIADSDTVTVTVTDSAVSAATQAQVNTGTATGVYVNPATLAEKVVVITASGTDTYTATIPGTLTSGRNFYVKFTNANTGAATLNGTAIKKSVSTALSSGDITAGEIKLLAYDGTNFQIVGGTGGGSVSVDGVTITGDGTPGNPLVATAGSGGLQASNNLSDVSSAATSRTNLAVLADRYTVADKSSGFAPRLTDFQSSGVNKAPLFRCTASFTVTLDQDSTDSIPIGFTILGMTMSTYTTTFAAGSSATVETSSGGSTIAASATENFVLWSATKRAANTWSVQNGRAPNSTVIYDTVCMAAGHGVTLTNQGSGLGDIASVTRYRFLYDSSWATKVKLMLNVSAGSASANNPRIHLQYSTDNSSWTTIGDGSTCPTDCCSLASIAVVQTNYLTLDSAAKGTAIYFRPVSVGGDGVADPAFGILQCTFSNA